MKNDVILAKTPKGLEEIQTRVHKLPQRMRTVLILVDGKTSAGQFVERLTAITDLDAILEMLLKEGFVAVASAGATATASVTADGPATVPLDASGAPHPDVRKAIRDLCRYLHDNLGPDADLITGRLEKARTRSDFIAAVRQAQSMLISAGPSAQQGGSQRAQQFQARAQALLDTWFEQR